MQKTTETEKLFSTILIELESRRQPQTLYDTLRETAETVGEDPDDLPEAAYTAAEAFVRCELFNMAKTGVKLLDEVFDIIEALPASAAVARLQKKATAAKLPFMFIAAVAKTAIEDVDADYLAEIVIERGKALAAEKTAKNQTAET